MHHANVLIGSPLWARAIIPQVDTVDSPDTITLSYGRMTIENARELIQDTLKKPLERTRRVFIISANSILSEAQNALLKLFEEPNEHTRFYLILPREDILIPTLRSRLNFLASEIYAINRMNFDAFLALRVADRIADIAKRLKDEDTEWVGEIVEGALEFAHEKKDPALMREILFVASSIRDVGASKKMLLEHLALSL